MSDSPDPLQGIRQYLGPKPPPIGFNPSVSPAAMTAIGYIIVHWGAFAMQVGLWTRIFRDMEGIPKHLVERKLRPGFKYEAVYLKDLASHVYKDGRPRAVKLYHANIDRALGFKFTRDALAHGTFAKKDNDNFDGCVCHYKNRKHHFPMKKLIETGNGISLCTGFLLSFSGWNSAPQMKTLLEKYQ